MRKIAIIGAGESGAQLALGLQREGYAITLFSDRSAAQIRTGKVMSSQCMFATALAAEAQLSPALTSLYDSGSRARDQRHPVACRGRTPGGSD